MPNVSMAELEAHVDAECFQGGKATGAQASLWDRAYYAAQFLFPLSTDSAHRTMADFTMQLFEDN